jgi:hypothetical protein
MKSLAGRVGFVDLPREHLWVVYPGKERYPLHEAITAVPLKNLSEIVRNLAGR